jgi:hypothetical protein
MTVRSGSGAAGRGRQLFGQKQTNQNINADNEHSRAYADLERSRLFLAVLSDRQFCHGFSDVSQYRLRLWR